MRILLFPLLFATVSIFAQFDSTAYKLAQTIQVSTLHNHVFTLASPEYEGRETGKPGNFKAARYIQNQFKADGIQTIAGDTNYFQEVSFSSIKWSTISLEMGGVDMVHMRDFVSNPQLSV